ncbi:hypothetical protein A3Q56_06978 [Intoshia linei]|uniref:Uncharacterized protein n=1 Tax=Intoshia linei TaxID=1819745 RepID=A0A177ATG3_9BILA|nr:hypothetical protein A3Q56_06978 [Intoshia linei]
MKIYDANLQLDNCGYYYTDSSVTGNIIFNVYMDYTVIDNIIIKLLGNYDISSKIKNKTDDKYAATIYSNQFFEKEYKILNG